MQAGKLRHRIEIQKRQTGGVDAFGGRSEGWSFVAKAWASIEPQTGRQLEFARQFTATVSHKITMRYVPGLSPAMRVKFGSRIFEINGVIDLEERHREINLFCTENATKGK